MNKVLTVAQMVFKKRVRSAVYYWMILAPLFFLALTFGIAKFTMSQAEKSLPRIAIVAPQPLKKVLEQSSGKKYRVKSSVTPTTYAQQKQVLKKGKVDGILVISPDFERVQYLYNSDAQATNPVPALQVQLTALRSQMIAAQAGIDSATWQKIIGKVKINQHAFQQKDTVNQTDRATADGLGKGMVLVAFLFLTSYVSIVGAEIGNEKSNHLIEGILAAVPARKHFAGKMLGIGALVVLQIIIYAVLGIIGQVILKNKYPDLYRPIKQFMANISSQYLFVAVILTLLTVALYVFLTAMIAAFVSRNEDISQATSMVTSLMFIPYILGFVLGSNPNMLIAKILGYVPFFSFGVMPVRLAMGAVPYWAGYVACALALVGAIAMYWCAAIVYERNAFAYSNIGPLKAIINKILRK